MLHVNLHPTHDLVTEPRERVDLGLVRALGLHRLRHQPHRRSAHGLVRWVPGQLLEVEVHLDLAVTAWLLGDVLTSGQCEKLLYLLLMMTWVSTTLWASGMTITTGSSLTLSATGITKLGTNSLERMEVQYWCVDGHLTSGLVVLLDVLHWFLHHSVRLRQQHLLYGAPCERLQTLVII